MAGGGGSYVSPSATSTSSSIDTVRNYSRGGSAVHGYV
jgi:hypothetical protein